MIKDSNKIIQKIRTELDKLCEKYDSVWRKRSRTIDTRFMINFIFKLVLNSDKGYGILLSDLLSETKINNKLNTNHIASSSICEARDNFPEKIIKSFNRRASKTKGKKLKHQKGTRSTIKNMLVCPRFWMLPLTQL